MLIETSIAAVTADPAKLVTAYNGIGIALKTVSEESKDAQAITDEQRQARRARKAATLNAVIQNIQAMIQQLEKGDDNHHHIQTLTAIQKSCTLALGHDHDHHDHGHDHIEHAAASAFAMAQSIRTTAERDDGPDETMENHKTHGHAARVGRRTSHCAVRPMIDPLAKYKKSGVISKEGKPSGADALSILSKGDDATPLNRVGQVHYLEGLAHVVENVVHKLH